MWVGGGLDCTLASACRAPHGRARILLCSSNSHKQSRGSRAGTGENIRGGWRAASCGQAALMPSCARCPHVSAYEAVMEYARAVSTRLDCMNETQPRVGCPEGAGVAGRLGLDSVTVHAAGAVAASPSARLPRPDGGPPRRAPTCCTHVMMMPCVLPMTRCTCKQELHAAFQKGRRHEHDGGSPPFPGWPCAWALSSGP